MCVIFFQNENHSGRLGGPLKLNFSIDPVINDLSAVGDSKDFIRFVRFIRFVGKSI